MPENKEVQYVVSATPAVQAQSSSNNNIPPPLTNHLSTPSTTVSFLHRIIPFGQKIGNSEKCSECIASKRSVAIEEFKSVQSLKQFWISAFGGNSNVVKCDRHNNRQTTKTKSATLRSVSMVDDSNIDPKLKYFSLDRNINFNDRLIDSEIEKRTDKCFSLDRDLDFLSNKNCSDLEYIESDRNKNQFVSDIVCNSSRDQEHSYTDVINDQSDKCNNALQPRKSSIDNFYKYKTADLVKNNRISDIHSSFDRSRESTKIVQTSATVEEPSRNAIGTIKSHKRLSNSNASSSFATSAVVTSLPPLVSATTNIVKDSIVLNENNKMLILSDNESETADNLSKEAKMTEIDNEMEDIIKAPELTLQTAADKALAHNMCDSISNYSSGDSSITSTKSTHNVVSTLAASESPRKQASGSVTRKCSFRTNSFHHHHKRMSAAGGISGGSKVAALTLRFNQLIQQDAEILEEVRRNKEMILHRLGGHVFKVMEEGESTKKRMSSSKRNENGENGTPNKQVKKKASLRRKVSVKSNKPGTVKATIEIFEKDERKTAQKVKVEKPKVPDKSAEVLQRTKEIAVLNNMKRQKVSGVVLRSNENKDKEERLSNKEKRMTLENIKEEKEEKTEVLCSSPTINESHIDSKTLTKIEKTDEHKEPDKTDEKSKKNKYSRLYEKLRFKTPFISRKPVKPDPVYSIPEQKIVNALLSVNERIEKLSKSENCLRKTVEDEDKHYEEVAKNIKPNSSFLFRSTSKCIFGSSHEISGQCEHPVEAINSILISKTRSMDETNFPTSKMMLTKQISLEEKSFGTICQNTDNLLMKLRDISTDGNEIKEERPIHEDDYEIIRSTDEPAYSVKQIQEISSAESPEIPETPIESFVHKEYQKIQMGNKNNENEFADSSSIYQSISEAMSGKTVNRDSDSLNSYESFENYEAVNESQSENIKNENGYEICDPPKPPEPPPPRKISDQSNKNLPSPEPELPVPKRNLKNYSNNLEVDEESFATYERIKYDAPLFPNRSTKYPQLSTKSTENSDSTSIYSFSYRYDYEENIYDTIKTIDSTSMVTDYESISLTRNFLRSDRVLNHADSTSTLSSDNKTNSLYGTTMCGRGTVAPSEGGSDNSDEWIDISDGEGDKKHRFVVICERKKCHRSPKWSRKVRDQRMNKQNEELYDDDSDHYYESLDAAENVSSKYADISKSSIKNGDNTPSNHIEAGIHDEYDSFDSDESDEDIRKNDSGVDVSNTKLPDPPSQPSQVYSLMQKIKNFGSISKSLTKLTKKKISSNTSDEPGFQKQKYENTQFYVQNDYQNVESKSKAKSKSKTPKLNKKKDSISDPYENTEFHSPRTTLALPASPQPSDVTASSPTLSHYDKNNGSKNDSDILSRKKSKSGKSFKSKFRKSIGTDTSINLGSSFNGNRSTFYISDSVDVDSGIFSSTDKVPTGDDLNASEITLTPSSPTIEDSDNKSLVKLRTNSKQSSPELNRRKSSLSVRPNNPPPPPPVDNKKLYKTKRLGTTSWYAECGVFKSETLNETQVDGFKGSRKDRKSTSSWYADAGLYQTSGASVASSSGSSGVSTGGECGPGDDSSHSMFLNEPLYQIYSAAKLESLNKDIELENGENSDGYEEIGGSQPPEDEEKKPVRPSALQLVGPKQGPSRTLWSEIPEVINSQILSTLTSTEKRLQEAKFEILTSEASYLKSLTLLRTHFMNHPAFRDTSILNSSDRKTLFNYIVSVHECSDRLLCDLENCWQDNIMLLGLSHSVYKHAEKYFHVYVTYCEHQGKLDRTLKRLKETKMAFCQALEILENDPVCCGLSLHSFLMLPMQRITRLPLLVDAVLSKLKLDDDEFESWKMTLAILNKIVSQCNEAANRSEQAYELEILSRQIEFPVHIRPLAIVPVGVPAAGTMSRSLVRRGELTHLIWRGDDGKLTFGKKFTKINIFAFLFTDLIVLAKKRTEDAFTVIDYCPRSLLTVSSGDVIPQLPAKELVMGGKHLIFMTLLENHEGKMVEMILSCPSETERQRWLHATEPPASENPDEKLYEQWDCPQVIANHIYAGIQPDELCLDPGDVVNVTRKMADGWYHGERIRDGAVGWFPGNYTEEVGSQHVRARNLKQRYRLLTFTAAYWESQRRKQ